MDAMMKTNCMVNVPVSLRGVKGSIAVLVDATSCFVDLTNSILAPLVQDDWEHRLPRLLSRIVEEAKVMAEAVWQAAEEERCEPRTKRALPGFIYVVKADNAPHYKIGRTTNLEKRVQALNAQSPFKSTLIHSFEVADSVRAEIELHERFQAKRINGEWFELSDLDVEFIKGCQLPAGG